MQLTIDRIARIIGSTAGEGNNTDIRTLLTDSRDLIFPESTLFFALRTEVNDGHNFVADLYAKGVRHFVIDSPRPEYAALSGAVMLIVPSVIDALQKIAAYVRSLVDFPVIGITGSRGKTVVKEQLWHMLTEMGYRVARSPRSYNSQIGVALSIWEIDPEHDEVAIIEAGISQPGEMVRLQRMIRPTIGVFTELTDEHADGFTDSEQKLAEKLKLFTETPLVYARNTGAAIDVASELILTENSNKALSMAVASPFYDARPADISLGEIAAHAPETVSSRVVVSETIKNCIVVHDGFSFDRRSTIDGLNIATRHLTPGRTLTMIIPALPDESPEFIDILVAKGVSRLITIDAPANVSDDRVKVEFCDFRNNPSALTISDFANEVIFVKGEGGSVMEEIKSILEAPRHETVMEVDLGAVTANFNFFRSKLNPGTGIVAMVKADGYGVGALELSKTLQNQGAAYLAVAVIDEGVALRRAGITMPIMVMNPIGTNYNALFENHIEPSVFSMRELRLLLDNARRLGRTDYPVHIKLDTGMHRLGFLEEELPELIEALNSQPYLKVVSIFSHLATADCLDQDEYTEMQLRNFDSMSGTLLRALPYPVKRHVLNTAGILRYPDYRYDMVRLGIGMYGVSPIDGYRLQPVARLIATIISIKHWGEGITIGYGRRGRVNKDSVIATIPIGYADGLNRHLSNGATRVLVNGRMCPIIGNICMDQCMVDVTGADASIGDTVEIFGPDAPIERLSDVLGTIPYEILTSVSPRAKRIYVRE